MSKIFSKDELEQIIALNLGYMPYEELPSGNLMSIRRPYGGPKEIGTALKFVADRFKKNSIRK